MVGEMHLGGSGMAGGFCVVPINANSGSVVIGSWAVFPS